jgi:FeS assembly protein IscX
MPIMKWNDINDIALALTEAHPDVNPQLVRFTDLHKWILALDGFDDAPDRSNEKILEAVQTAWIEEADY